MQKCAVSTKLCEKLRKMSSCAIPHPPHLNVAPVVGRVLLSVKRASQWEDSFLVGRELFGVKTAFKWEGSFLVKRRFPSGNRASQWEGSF